MKKKKKLWANKRVREALEHSDIINQDGVLLDDYLNLCLDEEGMEYTIPEKYWDTFRIWNEDRMEWGDEIKYYKVCYKFKDVVEIIEAKNEEDARKKAEKKLISDENPQNDTYCYKIKIKEDDD
jgi:hypothetical protein